MPVFGKNNAIFYRLDEDDSGDIDIDEFVFGLQVCINCPCMGSDASDWNTHTGVPLVVVVAINICGGGGGGGGYSSQAPLPPTRPPAPAPGASYKRGGRPEGPVHTS